MAEDSLDPRYDPMFQRGYEGRLEHSTVTERSRSEPQPIHPLPAPIAEVDHELEAVRTFLQPKPELLTPAPPSPAQPGPARSAASSSTPVVTTEIYGEDSGPVHRLRMPNPFILVLWLLGPALIIVSVSTLIRAFTEQGNSYGSPEEMVPFQLAWSLSPVMATIGLGIIAGLLFWHAARWRRAQ